MQELKVLQVTATESPGRRFNGLALTEKLRNYGVESAHLVWEKDTEDPSVFTFGGVWTKRVHHVINRAEEFLSLQSVLYPHALQMMKMQEFHDADLIHLHVIHSGYLSLASLPAITMKKPTVWTLHDPWAMTGHCIHPFECTRWKTGCGDCPNLKSHIPMRRDNTQFMFGYKKKAYHNSRFDLIVASQWMYDMVEESPMFDGVSVHQIPFGIDIEYFSAASAHDANDRFGISKDSIVICFRAAEDEFKGLEYIVEALSIIDSTSNIVLLALGNNSTLLDSLAGSFKIIKLPWTNDDSIIRDALVASDIFLMPSTAEAFGMMAIEAMACGAAVITFENTALPKIIFSPKIGISVPAKDSMALARAIDQLIKNPEERQQRALSSRKAAELHYSDEIQAQRLAEIYDLVRQKYSDYV